ncbi:hypothetical protein FB45DRAFT_940249 [Roridomyces roridus]|uniref:BTB domain-containing protein n=1 Tax=Roridomyces roridus TaxID=1738132 RepID=A0AAD7B6T3_9AGAR|nr:hypothetical protein FB45DRAFT_940249 [Roridomyces roridus]
MSRYCALFNPSDADVVFQSCDDILFGIHRANLETNTEGFPPAEFANTGEIIPLSESSSTLELLFQFIYPRRHPGLDDIAFEALAALAEAAEKYQVFSAMNICKIRMRDVLPNHAPEILAYASRHDYPHLVYGAAPFTFDVPLSGVVTALPDNLILPWVRYIDAWNTVLNDAISVRQRSHYNHQQSTQCRTWKAERPAIAQHFGHSLNSLRRLDVVFAPNREIKLPICCETAKNSWRNEIEDAMAQIAEFRSFL